MSPRWARARAWLARPSVVAIAAVIGVLTFAQGLGLGWQADDVWHQIFLSKPARWEPSTRLSPLALFSFYDGDPARTAWLVDQGIGPWWTDTSVRLAFFRPLTALTHHLDHALSPGSAAFAHAHSLLWYGALVAVVAALYRRTLGATWIAGLAALFYAVDYNHGVVATWVANRSALVAGTLGLGAVLVHARAREQQENKLIPLSAALLAGALFAGEVGVGACAWLAAWALTMDRGRSRERILSLAPHVAVSLIWAAIYRAGRWGAHGSGVYLDPAREPLTFAAGLVEKIPSLMAAEFGAPGPDLVMFGPRAAQLALFAFAAALTLTAAFVTAPILRESRAARFFALGAVLSLIPACATFASARQLMVPGVGLVGLVAQLVGAVADASPLLPGASLRRRVTVAFALYAGAGHGLFSPFLAQMSARQLWFLERLIHRWSDPIADAGLEDARLVVVNAPSAAFTGYIPPRRWADGRAVPRALLCLGVGARDLDLERADAHTLVARQAGGYALTELELLTAPPDRRWTPDDRVDLTGVHIQVLETTPDARPARVQFRFDAPLEDPSLRWVRWDGHGLVPFTPPPAGARARLAAQVLDPF